MKAPTTETFYPCLVCGLRYPTQELAKQCEVWCQEHQSCNLEIIKYALKEDN